MNSYKLKIFVRFYLRGARHVCVRCVAYCYLQAPSFVYYKASLSLQWLMAAFVEVKCFLGGVCIAVALASYSCNELQKIVGAKSTSVPRVSYVKSRANQIESALVRSFNHWIQNDCVLEKPLRSFTVNAPPKTQHRGFEEKIDHPTYPA